MELYLNIFKLKFDNPRIKCYILKISNSTAFKALVINCIQIKKESITHHFADKVN